MLSNNSMLLVTGYNNKSGGLETTFKMISQSKDCPFNEAIFSVEKQVLYVLSKEKKNCLQKLPERNEEVIVEKYYEYHLIVQHEIQNFIKQYASNWTSFEFAKYFK